MFPCLCLWDHSVSTGTVSFIPAAGFGSDWRPLCDATSVVLWPSLMTFCPTSASEEKNKKKNWWSFVSMKIRKKYKVQAARATCVHHPHRLSVCRCQLPGRSARRVSELPRKGPDHSSSMASGTCLGCILPSPNRGQDTLRQPSGLSKMRHNTQITLPQDWCTAPTTQIVPQDLR